jgi:hypothetical protein
MDECPNRQTNADACPCTNEKCERRGKCCACVRAHREGGSLPACLKDIGQGAGQ